MAASAFRWSELPGGGVALRASRWTVASNLLPLVVAAGVGGYFASGPAAAALAAGVLLLLFGALILVPAANRAAVLRHEPVVVIDHDGLVDRRRGLAIPWNQIASIHYQEEVLAPYGYKRRFLSVWPTAEGASLPRRRLEASELLATRKTPEVRPYLRDVQVGLGGSPIRREELGRIIRRYFDGELHGFAGDVDSVAE